MYNSQYNAGNVLTVLKAEKLVSDDFLLLNADHLFPSKAYERLISMSKDITIGSYHRKAKDDEMKIRFNSNGSTELSKTLETYNYIYPGLTTVSKEYVPAYFGCAKKIVDSYGDGAVVEQLILPLSKKHIPIHECDLGYFNFIEVDTSEDYKKAQTEIKKLI